MANVEWYYADVDNADVGPVSRVEFKKAFKAGRVTENCQCWTSTMSDWAPISQVPELLAFLKAGPAGSPPGPGSRKRPSVAAAGPPSGSRKASSAGTRPAAAAGRPEEAKESGSRAGAPGSRGGAGQRGRRPTSTPLPPPEISSGKVGVNGLMELPNMDGMTPDQIARVFYDSERHYVQDCLQVLMRDFRDRLDTHTKVGQDVLTPEQIMLEKAGMGIFPKDLTSLYELHVKLLQAMRSRLIEDVRKTSAGGEGGSLRDNIGAIMNMMVPFFGLYTDLVKNVKARHLSKLEEIRTENTNGFQTWLEVNEFVTGCQLAKLLTAPVERLPQYLMICGKLYQKQAALAQGKRTRPLEILSEAVRGIRQVTDKISQTIMDQQRRDQLLDVQMNNFKGSVDLVSASRKCFRFGNVKMLEVKSNGKYGKPKQQVFVLCNDCVVWGTGDVGNLSRGEKMKPGKPLGASPLGNMVVTDVEDVPTVFKNGFRIKCQNSKSEFIVRVGSAREKRLWLQDMQSAFAEFTESLNAATGGGEAAKESPGNFEKKVMKKKWKPDKTPQPKPNPPVLLDSQGQPFGAKRTAKPTTAAGAGGGGRRPGARPQSPRGRAGARPAGRPTRSPPGSTQRRPQAAAGAGGSLPPPPPEDDSLPLPPPLDDGPEDGAEQDDVPPPPGGEEETGEGEDPNYPWVECFDEESGSPYYENQETGESSWDPPSNWVDTSAAAAGEGAAGGEETGAPLPLGGGGQMALGASSTDAAPGGGGGLSLGGGGGFLGDISKGGFHLRKSSERMAAPAEEEPAALDMGAQLTESLANYRKFVVGDEDEEDDEDDDWD